MGRCEGGRDGENREANDREEGGGIKEKRRTKGKRDESDRDV